MRTLTYAVVFGSAALLPALHSAGQVHIIDLNSQSVCGHPLVWGGGPTLQLAAGRYELLPVDGPANGGLFIAWSPWSSNSGCDPSGANCTHGYKTRFSVRVDGGDRIPISGANGANNHNYATPALALSNAEPDDINLGSAADVMFYIHDTPCNDNRGGVTVRIRRICYANCDNSTAAPILNVDDFTCFINRFAAAQSLPHEAQVVHYANCDGSTVVPVLNVDDFTCFINEFAAGCP